MKTIGTCKECKNWDGESGDLSARCGEFEKDVGKPIRTHASFGCINWEAKNHPSDNYPTRTAQDLEIADLKRENNAAFERIQELSEELIRLGFDPTARR